MRRADAAGKTAGDRAIHQRLARGWLRDHRAIAAETWSLPTDAKGVRGFVLSDKNLSRDNR
jgi:hypothetical protein